MLAPDKRLMNTIGKHVIGITNYLKATFIAFVEKKLFEDG